MDVLTVGITGGSGAGKTTIAKELIALLGTNTATLIEADSYYKGCAACPGVDPGTVNYDHLDALDVELLTNHLERLSSGHSIEKPIYSFATHMRIKGIELVQPRAIVA